MYPNTGVGLIGGGTAVGGAHTLARTGFSFTVAVLAAGLLIVLGVLLLRAATRRRSQRRQGTPTPRASHDDLQREIERAAGW